MYWKKIMIKKKHIFLIFIFSSILTLLFSVIFTTLVHTDNITDQTAFRQNKREETYPSMNIRTKIIPSIDNSFGYEIIVDERIYIHQPSIPSLPGNMGFPNEANAQKVADLVVQKIRRQEIPPTITIQDLKRLRILK